MLKIGLTSDQQLAQLSETIGRRTLLSPKKIVLFSDLRELMPHLLAKTAEHTDHLISAGHVSPDIVIAADRKGLKVSETLGHSPFAASVDAAVSKIATGSELIYVANPNRITGANFGLADLEALVKAVPRGFLLVDEYYYDYFGITGLTLLEQYPNVGVLRLFAAAFGVESSDSGFFAGSPELVEHLRSRMSEQVVTATIYRTAMASLENDLALDTRLKTLHSEAMRISTGLTRLGVQNRITAADFLLLRVKEPTVVGNHLARHKIPFENLDGYPLLKGYLRYKIQSPLSNDTLLEIVNRIPSEHYRQTSTDRSITTLRRPGEGQPSESRPVANGNRISPNQMALGDGAMARLIPQEEVGLASPKATAESSYRTVPLGSITSNPVQPRRDFDAEKLGSLARSLKQNGLMQPLVVSKKENGYVLVAGERRLRAANMAGLSDVAVVVVEAKDDRRKLELALIENVQREDLNALELALAYRRLMDDCRLTQNEVAARVGKSRAAVANTLRLLSLPESIQQMVRRGDLSEGHARSLLAVDDEGQMFRIAQKIVSGSLSVRDAEREAGRSPKRGLNRNSGRPELSDMENHLQHTLGNPVKIVSGPWRGRIEIEYYGDNDLKRLLGLFRQISA